MIEGRKNSYNTEYCSNIINIIIMLHRIILLQCSMGMCFAKKTLTASLRAVFDRDWVLANRKNNVAVTVI